MEWRGESEEDDDSICPWPVPAVLVVACNELKDGAAAVVDRDTPHHRCSVLLNTSRRARWGIGVATGMDHSAQVVGCKHEQSARWRKQMRQKRSREWVAQRGTREGTRSPGCVCVGVCVCVGGCGGVAPGIFDRRRRARPHRRMRCRRSASCRSTAAWPGGCSTRPLAFSQRTRERERGAERWREAEGHGGRRQGGREAGRQRPR